MTTATPATASIAQKFSLAGRVAQELATLPATGRSAGDDGVGGLEGQLRRRPARARG